MEGKLVQKREIKNEEVSSRSRPGVGSVLVKETHIYLYCIFNIYWYFCFTTQKKKNNKKQNTRLKVHKKLKIKYP